MAPTSERGRALSRVCCVALLVGVGFTSTAFARDDERGKWKPDDRGLAQRVAALEAALAATQAELAYLKKNTVLELNGKLKLTQQNGYATALFKGVNVQVVNGLGKTDSINGLGNLIVGYNTARAGLNVRPVCSNGEYQNPDACAANGFLWAENHKSGSHNIVGGDANAYSSFGGLVVGKWNAINNVYSSVSGGRNNIASGFLSSVSGGQLNTASSFFSSVSGGSRNTASGGSSSVSGGEFNAASDFFSSVSGGFDNTASSPSSSVSGGRSIFANGISTWAAGGLCEPAGTCRQGPPALSGAKRPALPKLPTLPQPNLK
jgi:hypothetical protein